MNDLVISGLGTPLKVPVSRIRRFEGQPRKFFDPKELEVLAESLLEIQETPISLTRDPSLPAGVFVLINGERRWRAQTLNSQRAGKDLTLDAIVRVVPNLKEHFRSSVRANLMNHSLTPLDEASSISRLKADGDSIAGIAKLLGKSVTYVNNYLKVDQLSDEVKMLMNPSRSKEDVLRVTQAIEIASSTGDHKLQLEIALECVERGLSLIDTRSLIELRTGINGYRHGGVVRRPSDDYRVLTTFLGGTKSKAERLSRLNLDALYYDRPDARASLEKGTREVNSIIASMRTILEGLERMSKDGFR